MPPAGAGEPEVVVSDLRARRGDPPPAQGPPTQRPPTPGPASPWAAGRVESAETAVRALEERLGSILRRIEDAEEGRRRAVDRLAESERQAQLERSRRERAESLPAGMRSAQRRVALVVADLRVLAARLRVSAEGDGRVRGAPSGEPGSPPRAPRAPRPEPAMAPAAAPPGELRVAPPAGPAVVARRVAAEMGPAPSAAPAPAVGDAPAEEAALNEEGARGEMTDALAAAITRLRGRVEESSARQAPEGGAREGSSPVALLTRTIGSPDEGGDWLAGAIRRVAERRDRRLAAELIVELLPARRGHGDRAVSYGVQIAELGAFIVRPAREGAGTTNRPERAPGGLDTAEPDFVLQGPLDAFVRLAAGGRDRDRDWGWRRGPGRARALRDLRVHGSRRSARRLAAACEPLSLAELARGGVEVWPGLLLLALAEAIEPEWTVGRRLAVAFAIEGPSAATVRAHVRDGEPVLITRERGGEEPPALTMHLSEHAFICLFAGVRLPAGERMAFEGDLAALQALLDLTDRAQGLGGA